jgi:hypothetical protein
MTQFPTPVDPQTSTNRMSDEELRRLAAEQAEELGLRNQAAIEMARQDAANRLSGTTNYGQAVEQPVADYLARNTTQRDVQIAQGQAQRPGERPGDYLDRMNLDPNAGLNQAYMEERTARQTQHYAERERAIREVLSRGVQNVSNPTARRLASEFVITYPVEYSRIIAEMRGEPAARETIPFDQELLDRITQDSMYGREERMADADRRSQQQVLNRFNSLDQSQKSMYLRAAGGDTNKAAELYMQQLRKERGIDPESRRSRQNDIARSRAISAISGRHGGDPTMVRRAIENWNSRNPSNPLTPEDFGMPAAGQNVTARPGEVVEVDDVRNVNPRNVSPGAIMVDATGAWRAARRPDGSMYQQPVLEDRNSGFHFPDPDKYGTQDAFDNAMTRQDRVDMRQAILNSGNSVLANEQRRLEAARQAAASSIPEIRDAGIKEVNELERDLHWRYVTEAASLAGPAPIGGRQEIELGPAPGQSRPRSERPITIKDVNDRLSEIMTDFANFEQYDRFEKMTPEQRKEEVFRILEEERQPYRGRYDGLYRPVAIIDENGVLTNGPMAGTYVGRQGESVRNLPLDQSQPSGVSVRNLPRDRSVEAGPQGYRVSLLGLPAETPRLADSASWNTLMNESYGPFIDREVDKIQSLDPSMREAAFAELESALQDFGIAEGSAPASVIQIINQALTLARREIGVTSK